MRRGPTSVVGVGRIEIRPIPVRRPSEQATQRWERPVFASGGRRACFISRPAEIGASRRAVAQTLLPPPAFIEDEAPQQRQIKILWGKEIGPADHARFGDRRGLLLCPRVSISSASFSQSSASVLCSRNARACSIAQPRWSPSWRSGVGVRGVEVFFPAAGATGSLD